MDRAVRFFRGVARYRESGGDPLNVQFYGDWRQPYWSAAEDLSIAEWIEPMDAIPHDELISVLKVPMHCCTSGHGSAKQTEHPLETL